ncbi:rRNA-processing protein EBP2 [Yamadazyma tenuis]|uniref:rRNA-processing protein EBP2 n=1 Tax=Candida tenuis TaxID=2315449 RepID=UPI0027A5BE4F|nr:rRNA-processing protein EBP2 [Yamadazyma tenuis]
MGKRGTLKTQLDAHKLLESIDKSRSKPVKKVIVEAEEPEVPVPKVQKRDKKDKVKAKSKKEQDDYQSEALSKKEQRKLKKSKPVQEDDEEEEEGFLDAEAEEGSDEEDEELDINRLGESESDSELEEAEEEGAEEEEAEEEDAEEKDAEEEEDVPFSDVEVDSDADVVPYTKLTINNVAALKESLARVQLPWKKHSFVEHQSIVSEEKTEVGISDIYDDTERELAFYKQGLDATKQGRANLLKLKVAFSRPMDYFAEMVKSDEHMDKLKNKLLTEAANKKASEEAKRQRSLKKFGKQVQHETLQERAKQKRDTLEKVKSLKKRRANNELAGEDDFQIALEEATREESRGGDSKRHKPNGKRVAKNSKYGFGGKKAGSRKNDAKSSADISDFSSKKMKQKRPGKSKRTRR